MFKHTCLFYRYGLEDTDACQHLLETQKAIDDALRDSLILVPIGSYEATLIGVMNHVNFSAEPFYANVNLAASSVEVARHRHQKKRGRAKIKANLLNRLAFDWCHQCLEQR